MITTKPAKLNGKQLRDELRNNGIAISDDFDSLVIDENDMLVLQIDKKYENLANEIVKNHIGVDREMSIDEKLNLLGISVEDLRNLLK